MQPMPLFPGKTIPMRNDPKLNTEDTQKQVKKSTQWADVEKTLRPCFSVLFLCLQGHRKGPKKGAGIEPYDDVHCDRFAVVVLCTRKCVYHDGSEFTKLLLNGKNIKRRMGSLKWL